MRATQYPVARNKAAFARRAIGTMAVAIGILAGPQAQAADLRYTLSFDDPLGLSQGYQAAINTHLGAALGAWSGYLKGSASFHIQIAITDEVDRATGRSATAGYVRHTGLYDIYEQGMAFELRTGRDPNGDLPDIEITLNPDYLANELWFDPNPGLRVAPVDQGRTDAMSVFMHELGHALAFNGWGGPFDGGLPGTYASTWDELIRFDAGNIFFMGANAQRVYGGPVPVTLGNNFHLGNGDGPGIDLVDDLMNGVVYYRGERYAISALDVAMLRDMGLPMATAVPEPGAALLVLAGLGALGLRRRRR